MATTIADIVEGDLTRTEEGFAHTRVFLVQGLAGNGPARLKNAIETNGIPTANEPHPVISGIRVTSTRVELVNRDPGTAKVTVDYGIPTGGRSADESGSGQVEFSAETITEETSLDVNGNLILTAYLSNLAAISSATITQTVHRVQVERPTLAVTLSRTESALPRAHAVRFYGTVNSTNWSGFGARLWLCTGINSNERDDGKYDVAYRFRYNRNTWKAFVRVKVNGLVPVDAVPGNGVEEFDVYPLDDFNVMGVYF